jgi:hypothetical protein
MIKTRAVARPTMNDEMMARKPNAGRRPKQPANNDH